MPRSAQGSVSLSAHHTTQTESSVRATLSQEERATLGSFSEELPDIAANLAWWNANTTGKDEDFKKKEEIQNELDAALADALQFAPHVQRRPEQQPEAAQAEIQRLVL